jgi:hypothetical protein
MRRSSTGSTSPRPNMACQNRLTAARASNGFRATTIVRTRQAIRGRVKSIARMRGAGSPCRFVTAPRRDFHLLAAISRANTAARPWYRPGPAVERMVVAVGVQTDSEKHVTPTQRARRHHDHPCEIGRAYLV